MCKDCDQPYWWNDRENSSPAKAMKMADRLFNAVSRSMMDDEKENVPSNGFDVDELDEEDTDSGNEPSEPLSLELIERITIAMQGTEIKEENLDMFPSSSKNTRPAPTPPSDPVSVQIKVQTNSLSASFLKRDQIVKTKTVIASQNIKSNGNIHGVAEPSSDLSTLLVEDASDTLETLESEVTQKDDLSSSVTAETAISTEQGDSTRSETSSVRKFRSAFASIHDGKEARVTNWSSDFKE